MIVPSGFVQNKYVPIWYRKTQASISIFETSHYAESAFNKIYLKGDRVKRDNFIFDMYLKTLLHIIQASIQLEAALTSVLKENSICYSNHTQYQLQSCFNFILDRKKFSLSF